GESVSLPLASALSGDAPFVYSLEGELPAGLSVDTTLRRIRGMPSAIAAKRALNWRVRDARGLVGLWSFELEVADGAYFASRAADREYTVGESVTLKLPEARGGSGNFSAEVRGLPDGLLFASGAISGVPSRAGHGTVTYTATDTTRGGKISQEFRVNIVADDSEEFGKLTAPEDGIGGKILVLPFTIAELDEETRFVWSDTGGAGDARLGADYTVTPSSFTVNALGDLQPDVFTVTTREPADNYIEARVRRAEISTVAVSGDTGKLKTTAFPLTIADIDADAAVLRMTLRDAASGDATATFAVNAERRVKIRAELVRPSTGAGGGFEQALTASQAIEISLQHPPEWGAASGAPQTLRLGARRSSAETGAFALTPTAAGTFTLGATFTPHLGALQNSSVRVARTVVTTRPLAIGDDRSINEAGGVSQQMVESTIAPGEGVAVSASIGADESSGANSASPGDFVLGRQIVSAFPLEFAAGSQNGNAPFFIPIPLRANDRLVEGRETFTLRLRAPGSVDARATITIDADGAARLDVRAPRTAAGAGAVFTGTLQLERVADTGIAVGAGGSLTYANENSPPQLLVFADGDGDGVLRGAELRAQSGAWTVEEDAREQTFQLQNADALPAGLRAAQFLPAGGARGLVPKLPVVALNHELVSLTEGVDFADATLSVTITPPLEASAGLLLSYTATGTGADAGVDYSTATSPHRLPAETGAVLVPGFIIDDAITETAEEYTLTISAPPGAGYTVDPEKNSVRVTIADNDTSEVTFGGRDSQEAIAAPGGNAELRATIGGVVQVGANGEVIIADEARKVRVGFADASGDGLLQGDELRQDFVWPAPSGDYRATTFAFAFKSAPRGLTAEKFAIGELAVKKRVVMKIENAAASRAETESGAYSLSIGATIDADHEFGAEVVASFDEDGPRGAAPKTLRKTLAFAADDDARTAKPVVFTADDFAQIGVADNSSLDAERMVQFTAHLDAATLAAGAAQVSATYMLAIEDDERRSTQVRYRLVNADGGSIAAFRTGSPSIAHISAELFQLQPASGGGATSFTESPVTLGIPSLELTPRLPAPGAAGLAAGELGGITPPQVRILFGESRAVSSDRVVITPARDGTIRFATASMQPPILPLGNLAADAPNSARGDAPDRSAPVALARNIVLDALGDEDSLLDEGASGVTLGFRIENLQGAEAALQAGGKDAAAVLTYSISPGEIASLRAQDDDLADLPGKNTSFGAATVTIQAGATRGTIPIPDIADDNLEEGPEVFVIALTGVSTAADGSAIAGAAIPSARAAARYAIARSDTPAEKLLRLEVLGASEAAGAATITLTRPAGAGNEAEIRGLLQPRATTEDGVNSADAADYDDAGRAFTIAAGAPSAQVLLPLLNDAVIEGDEEFRLNVLITAPEDGSVVAPPRAARVTIKDDDRGEIAMETNGLRASEGQVLTVRVTLSAEAKRDVRFTVTPVFGSGEGKASAADFLVSGPGNTFVTAGDADALTVSDSIAAG
ncbi:MAG: putative Ig domain-containing protein, partial [Gammaproteobacteria bacterium]|nr:putative Ig domain-containing protein [Gammaproteobacteria bacterium]